MLLQSSYSINYFSPLPPFSMAPLLSFIVYLKIFKYTPYYWYYFISFLCVTVKPSVVLSYIPFLKRFINPSKLNWNTSQALHTHSRLTLEQHLWVWVSFKDPCWSRPKMKYFTWCCKSINAEGQLNALFYTILYKNRTWTSLEFGFHGNLQIMPHR